jgi:hypothetical protein
MNRAHGKSAPTSLGDAGAPAGRMTPDLGRGIAVIQTQVRNLPGAPGVYRMLNARGDALYVGKARNLKKRVASYANPGKLSHRLQRMVAETVAMEVITTHTEVEALLLESNLVKRLMPQYNVLLRDDKSFPFILVTADLFRAVRLRRRGQPYHYRAAACVLPAQLLGCGVREPHAAVPAISDQALQRALRRLCQPRRVREPGRPGA